MTIDLKNKDKLTSNDLISVYEFEQAHYLDKDLNEFEDKDYKILINHIYYGDYLEETKLLLCNVVKYYFEYKEESDYENLTDCFMEYFDSYLTRWDHQALPLLCYGSNIEVNFTNANIYFESFEDIARYLWSLLAKQLEKVIKRGY